MGCSTGDPACENDERRLTPWTSRVASGWRVLRSPARSTRSRRWGEAARAAAGENLPMTELNWAEAKAYCAVRRRAPAQRSGMGIRGSSGTTVRYYDSLPAIAWFADNSDEQLHPVGHESAQRIRPVRHAGQRSRSGSGIAITTSMTTQATQRPSKNRSLAMPPAWRAAAPGSPTLTASGHQDGWKCYRTRKNRISGFAARSTNFRDGVLKEPHGPLIRPYLRAKVQSRISLAMASPLPRKGCRFVTVRSR